MRLYLLIVPYGIETEFLYAGICYRFKLLIVPYGIETAKNDFTSMTDVCF